MKTCLKTVAIGAMLFVAAPFSLHAETIPTVINSTDIAGRFADLSAKSAPDIQDLRQLAMLVFIKAAKAPELSADDVKKTSETLAALAQKSNGDPELVAIRAVFYGIQAREARSNLDALILAKKGVSVLDKLVQEHPDNGGVLLQRGLSALYAPSFLGRDSVFVDDFKSLLSSRFSLPATERAYVLYNLLKGYKKIGDLKAGNAVQAELEELNVSPWSDLGAKITF